MVAPPGPLGGRGDIRLVLEDYCEFGKPERLPVTRELVLISATGFLESAC